LAAGDEGFAALAVPAGLADPAAVAPVPEAVFAGDDAVGACVEPAGVETPPSAVGAAAVPAGALSAAGPAGAAACSDWLGELGAALAALSLPDPPPQAVRTMAVAEATATMASFLRPPSGPYRLRMYFAPSSVDLLSSAV